MSFTALWNVYRVRSCFFFTSCALFTAITNADETAFSPELFAFQTGFANAESQAPSDLVDLVAESGFDGVELMGLGQVERFMPHLKRRGLKLHSLYLKLDIDRPDQPVDPNWGSALEKYGEDLNAVWFHVHSKKYGRSDPAGDAECVAILQKLSGEVAPHGIQLGIYHHVGLWAEKFSDSVRVGRQVDRPNVGAVFNLCHYLKMNGPQQLERDLDDAFPHVALVSINGADDGETALMGWDRLIQSLDRGSFDVTRVLQVLKQNAYGGPIGLQGYAIQEMPEDFFPRSVAAYRQMLEKVNGSGD